MSALPVAYKTTLAALRRHGCESWGLHFDKFVKKEHNGKGDQLKSVQESYEAKPSHKAVQNAISRRLSLFNALKDEYGDAICLLYFRNTSRLILQMARSSILENTGMSFEPITGMPMVNGTALKGAVSTWAIWEANGDNVFKLTTDQDGKEVADINGNRAEIDAELAGIFGDNSGVGDNACAGNVVFYGLFPLDVPKLGIDILTPHPHSKGDRGPNPNHFLAIEPGTLWLCPLRLMRKADSTILDRTEKLIADCLTTTGLGAKTAAGYGRFERISEPTEIVRKWQVMYRETQASVAQQAEENKRALAEQEKMARLEATEAGMARYAAMADQEFVTFVNRYQHEEGMVQWPGTLQEQYDLFSYCTGDGQARCTGKKQKKAIKNLTAKFGGRQND
ncbi:MAG: type III-B CRISPR module RAMP protein Cmr6 [Candidatus Pacebacteria bacterium]|nr:type III-B CRISPR module RAMP protein Cmr6 [Candidatus Paceibacterota bacterium]